MKNETEYVTLIKILLHFLIQIQKTYNCYGYSKNIRKD